MTTINLKAAQVPVREQRLGSITGFAGTAWGLVKEARAGCLRDKARSFSQCLGCSTAQAACTIALIQDAVLISHGPVGCASCLHEYAFTYRVNGPHRNGGLPVREGTPLAAERRIFSTNIQEKDTIYGAAAKLQDTIREVYRRVQPAAIFIITTCASGIIGDDVEAAADEAEEELGIPVSAVFCEGFRSKIWTSGFDAGYHGIARKLIKKADQKQPDLVNIINFWGADIFAQWFARLGLRAQYLTPFATVEQIARSAEAVLSVQICATLGSYLGAALEQEFGVAELRASPPYGIAQTERWFRALGEATGREAAVEKFLREERERWLPEIEALREKLRGKTAYVTAGASHGHSLLGLLRELGMEPQGAAIFHHDPLYDNGDVNADTLQHVVEDYGDFPRFNVCNKQEFELANIFSRLKPDILLARHGGMTLWGAKYGIPSLLIGDEHFGMGYEGLVKYGRRILETIENDEFVKNFAKHTDNPYTDWWLAQEPYHFLEKGSENDVVR
ncbi:MAG: nitrogenase [Treponema sp.]|jgi:nitrogenase molybdenum-iron protein alpha chain|nr:nitrogenase [Treponema sp.]